MSSINFIVKDFPQCTMSGRLEEQGVYFPSWNLFKTLRLHCIKYSIVRVFSDPYIPIRIHSHTYTGNTGQRKPIFWHILGSPSPWKTEIHTFTEASRFSLECQNVSTKIFLVGSKYFWETLKHFFLVRGCTTPLFPHIPTKNLLISL